MSIHTLAKYRWISWYNQMKGLYQRIEQKNTYEKKKNIVNLSIERIDNRKIVYDKSEIRLFAIMRNESLRLPYFINYYNSLKIDRLLIVDNNSTDNSVDIALSFNKIHVFKTTESYQNHWCWMEYLLEEFGKGHWCIVVDIDELLIFPHNDILSVHHICKFLEDVGDTALRALLLDIYSDQTVRNTVYVAGQNPLDSCSYFDMSHYEVTFPYFDHLRWKFFESTHFTGGMRERVFGKSKPVTSLNKFPLFKNISGTYLGQGMHAINGSKISDLQGVVFHTKFLSDFIQEAQEEAVREQHFNKASYYKDFKRKFDCNPDLCLANSDSVRYRDSAQLVELGLLKTNAQFEEFVRTQSPGHLVNGL